MKSSMKLTIKNNPDNAAVFKSATHCLDLALSVNDIIDELRKKVKYDDGKNSNIYEEIIKMVIDVLEDHNINIDWILE